MKIHTITLAAIGLLVAADLSVGAGFLGSLEIDLPHTFSAGTPARAAEVNENFDAIAVAFETRALDVDGRLDALAGPENLITVSASGADFTSVAAALESITGATDENRYLVCVGPGVYDEVDRCIVPGFVTLRGAGIGATVVRSSRNGPIAVGTDASTIRLRDRAAIEDMRIENNAEINIAVAINGTSLSRETRLANVAAVANGAGGLRHYGVIVSEGDLAIVNCQLIAEGATSVNSAFTCSDLSGAFSQPLLVGSEFRGAGPTTGFGLQFTGVAAQVDGCRVRGESCGIEASIAGISRVRDSKVETLGLNPVYEQTGSSSILSGGVAFVGGNPLGLASQFKYVHCIKANFDPIVNGTGSSVQ